LVAGAGGQFSSLSKRQTPPHPLLNNGTTTMRLKNILFSALASMAATTCLTGCIVVDANDAVREASRAVDAAAGAASAAAAAMPATATPPPIAPCILVVQGTVTDRANFFGNYVAALPPLYTRYGGSYLAVGRPLETLEGSIDFQSVVMSRWPSCDAARAFWNSSEYQALAAARQPWGSFDVFLIEGAR
jgi:uncharacterized protein (DUF1330 family)